MIVVLPDHIPLDMFEAHDGRITTEAQILLRDAETAIRIDGRRAMLAPSELRKAVVIALMAAQAQRMPRHAWLPILGLIRGSIKRGNIWSGSISNLLAGLGIRLVAAELSNRVKRTISSEEPAWNDYYLAFWFLTGDDQAAEELYARAASDSALLRESAAWMVTSVRAQLEDFDAAICQIERRHGKRIPDPRCVELAIRPGGLSAVPQSPGRDCDGSH